MCCDNGVSKTFTYSLAERLKQNMFSLNVDESTTKSKLEGPKGPGSLT